MTLTIEYLSGREFEFSCPANINTISNLLFIVGIDGIVNRDSITDHNRSSVKNNKLSFIIRFVGHKYEIYRLIST